MFSEEHRGAQDECRHEINSLQAEVARLQSLINSPHTADFMQAVQLEAAHQRERWAAEQDAGKNDEDWFWLLGYLAGKALGAAKIVADENQYRRAFVEVQREKALHHIITTAAACLNWHAARAGVDTRMRPGIAPPASSLGESCE